MPDTLYGSMDTARFLATYRQITPARHRRDMRRAMQQGDVCPYQDVLMEDPGDGTVMLLPADAWPTPWRTLWRQMGEEHEHGFAIPD